MHAFRAVVGFALFGCATGAGVGSGESAGSGGSSAGGTSGRDAATDVGSDVMGHHDGAAGSRDSAVDRGSAGASGGAAGASGASGAAGAGGNGNRVCGTETCAGTGLLGVVALPACCPAGTTNSCGIDSTPVTTFDPRWPLACIELDQPGRMEVSCPMETLTVGVNTLPLPGCCRPAGVCGWFFDLSSLGGPTIGCADSTPFLDGGVPPSCTP